MTIQEDLAATYKLFAAALEVKGYSTVVEGEDDDTTMVTYVNPAGASWKTRGARISYPFNSVSALMVAEDKYAAYQLVEKAGFSIPHTIKMTDKTTDDDLKKFLQEFGRLIVKPADSLQSRGLTIGIETLDELKTAIEYAKTVSPFVLVQEQISGEELRFTVIDGKVESVLLRQTARVIGDGKSSIAELIARENDIRQTLQFRHLEYPLLDETIVDPALLHSAEIPPQDEVVELNRSTMIRGGCSVYDVLASVEKSYISIAEALAAKLGAGFVVVDIFCDAYEQPATATNYHFIEFNTTPSLKLYYSCRDRKQFDIVTRLAEYVDSFLWG